MASAATTGRPAAIASNVAKLCSSAVPGMTNRAARR